MSIIGWYYLHENGDLIYKRNYPDIVADLRDSSFIKSIWPLDQADRAGAWRILVEALSLGVKKSRVAELAELWKCNDDGAHKYAAHLGVELDIEGDSLCAKQPGFINLQESEAGFGDTYLEALADLCKELGFRGGKMWNSTFESLCKKCA